MEELIMSVILGMMVGGIIYRRVRSSRHVVRMLRVKRMICTSMSREGKMCLRGGRRHRMAACWTWGVSQRTGS